MAKGKTNRNYGRIYGNWLKRESKLVDKIDQRTKKGEYDKENVRCNKISENELGTCWSF